jgi:hypothetical protein
MVGSRFLVESSGSETTGWQRCRLCPVGQACAVPCARSAACATVRVSGLFELVHAVERGRDGGG